jgi:hypothetical protein
MTRKILTLLCFITISTLAQSENVFEGEFKSLDGKYHHIFKNSGDYWGEIKIEGLAVLGADFKVTRKPSENKNTVTGVFLQEKSICGNTDEMRGNLVIYTGEVQCCLYVRKISDKYPVTKIWSSGYGEGAPLCNTHILSKVTK